MKSPPFRNVDPLLEGLEPPGPAEALLVRRAGLIRILRNSLGELHDHRRLVAGAPAEAETVREIEADSGSAPLRLGVRRLREPNPHRPQRFLAADRQVRD